jgi:ABC-type nitrate/sulfonate/bicarbonate transport system substrate-binding protein
MTTRPLTHIRINVFPGVQNLPNFAAEHNGFFEKRGLSVETTFTKSSEQQRRELATGECSVAHSAVDNALAMADVAGIDVSIVVGLDHGFNKLIVQPAVSTYEDLRGKIFGVDAPDTAFALLFYEILRRKGLKKDEDYKVEVVGATRFRLEALKQKRVDFAVLNLPFNLLAQEAGLKVLDDPIDVIGPYQSTGGFVRRDWAESHRDTLTRYIAAYVEGLRWASDPANGKAAIALLERRMELAPDMAERCYQRVSDPKNGFASDAKIDRRGMEAVVQLRADFSRGLGAASPPLARYVDETFYNDALAIL